MAVFGCEVAAWMHETSEIVTTPGSTWRACRPSASHDEACPAAQLANLLT
jgi:hypothetical protein